MAFQNYDVGDVIPVGDTFLITDGIDFAVYAYHPYGMGDGMRSGHINKAYIVFGYWKSGIMTLLL